MKQINLFTVFFLFTIVIYSQKKSGKKINKHEISFGFVTPISNIKLSYDYLLDANSSIGTSMSYSPKYKLFSKKSSHKNELSLKFNYKYYLLKNNKGLYFKSEISYYNGIAYRYNYQNRAYTELGSYQYQNLHLGLNIGYKYVFKNNFFIDANVGLSTKIIDFNPSHNYMPNKQIFSFSIGKRF